MLSLPQQAHLRIGELGGRRGAFPQRRPARGARRGAEAGVDQPGCREIRLQNAKPSIAVKTRKRAANFSP